MNDALLPTRERVAAAVRAYYCQADGFELTAQELLEWYRSLTPPARLAIGSLGPYNWSMLPQFKRYALENRGYRLREYLSVHLTPDELAYWIREDAVN